MSVYHERYLRLKALGFDPGGKDPCIDCGEGGERTCRKRGCPSVFRPIRQYWTEARMATPSADARKEKP